MYVELWLDTLSDIRSNKLILNAVFSKYRFFDHNVRGELSVVYKLLKVKKSRIDSYDEEKGKKDSKFTKKCNKCEDSCDQQC